jgi:hypothetical protein
MYMVLIRGLRFTKVNSPEVGPHGLVARHRPWGVGTPELMVD